MSRIPVASQHGPETEGKTIHWARGYDAFVFLVTLGRASMVRARTADLAHLATGEAVLDVGCGTGDLVRQLRRRVGAAGLVAGIDASPEMIARARQKAQSKGATIDFRVEPIEGLSFADDTFDVVVSSFVFHHLPLALKQKGLVELKRVLKPGGRVLIVDFLRMSHQPFFHSALQIGAQDLPALLTEAGFSEVTGGRGPFRGMGYARGSVKKG